MMQERSDRTTWLALLLLVPSAGLALPFLLAADPLPHAAGTGWALLLMLPAAGLLPFCLQRGLPKSALLFLPHIALTILALAGNSSSDTFELQRAAMLLALTVASFLAGSALDTRAILLFQRGAILVSLGFSLQALFAVASFGSAGAAGPLGNTGALSQVALPGAVLGAIYALRGPLLFRGLGALAALAFGVHAGTTPVLTGALAFALALGAWVALAPSVTRFFRSRALAFAAVAPLCLLLAPVFRLPAPSASTDTVSAEAVSSNTGGVEVRLRIWKRALRMSFDHALTGVGPGQFRASFPPYRDEREIELSTYQHHSEVGGEVEHAHSDWVQAFAEFGLIGGLSFCALLVLVARSAWRACRRSCAEFGPRAALGPACLALLINATQHAPLSFEPAPLVLAWVLFGASLRSERATSSRGALAIGLAVVLPLFLSLTAALRLVRHGEGLAKRQLAAALYGEKLISGSFDTRALNSEFWLEEGRLLRDALEQAPDSTTALSLQAVRFAKWNYASTSQADAREAWERVLARRPHQVSALIGFGILAEDNDSRRAHWKHALELDPGHPTALENLARLESLNGSPDRAFEYIDRLRAAGHLNDELLSDLGARVLLAGRTRIGTELLASLYPEFDLERPEDWFALSEAESLRGGRSLKSDAQKATAHRLWGLENLESGEFRFALSKLRQALKISRVYLPNGDLPTRLLLIASYELSGDPGRAQLELDALERESIASEDWRELPKLATDALERLGLQAPARTGL